MSREVTIQASRTNIFQDATSFESAQRMATALSKSTLVPKEYQNNVPNCLIALEFSQRTGFTSMMVMQNLYIVHGRPGWSSQFIIAAMNSCGRFKPLMFDIEGEGDDYGCVAWTEDKDGRKLSSSRITIGMAKKEGWYSKNGSKWQTMAEQMLKYRSASFLGKIYAPDILMGMQTVEELEDIASVEPKDVTPRPSELSAAIAKAKEEEAKAESVPAEVVVSEDKVEVMPPIKEEKPDIRLFDLVLGKINAAQNRDQLDECMNTPMEELSDSEKGLLYRAYENKIKLLDRV